MTAKAEREARLAARLRDNLKKRKVAARDGPAAEPAVPAGDERDPGSSPG